LSFHNISASALQVNKSLVPDANGVMMYDYGGSVGKVYNPKVLALAGLKYFNEYREENDEQAKMYFLSTADWLVSSLQKKGSYSLWEYKFPWPHYGGVNAPYASALAQAEGINVLIKAHNMTDDERYLTAAKKAFSAFMVDYESGGVASDEGRDSIFLRLLAKPGFQKTYVLIGYTNSLCFIWNYYAYTRDYRALIVLGKGINWLVGNLHKYDTGEWSYYDLMRNLASDDYHHSHINQLAQLYNITKERMFKDIPIDLLTIVVCCLLKVASPHGHIANSSF
jgi:heparosan-N-sulfate-glucuronate 5-epimerase